MIPIDKIEAIKIFNNKGEHQIKESLFADLKKQLGEMTYEPGLAVKAGGNSITLKMNSNEFTLFGNSRGKYLEVPGELVREMNVNLEEQDWLCFKANGLNIENY